MIRVNGLNYTVRCVDVPISSNFDGETAFSDCTIAIRASMPSERQQQTLWHEIMHIFLEGEKGGGLTPEEERYVTRISNTLFSTLVDNKLLVPGWWDRVVDEHVFSNESIATSNRGRKRDDIRH